MSDFRFLTYLYNDIYLWLASSTPGEHVTKGYFKAKDKKVWNKIKDKFIELEKKKELSELEKEFLDCKYIGKAYRIINYYKHRNGHVYPIDCYQSCSKSINGIKNVSLHGNVILIELLSSKNSYSIDLFKLLEFMVKNKLIVYKDEFELNHYNIRNLESYYNEEEVLVILSEDNIKNISVRNFKKNSSITIEKSKWYRNRL